MKSETEKPETSKDVKLPIRIPIAKEIIPIDNMVSSLKPISNTNIPNNPFYY
jgi:hypothetical protein